MSATSSFIDEVKTSCKESLQYSGISIDEDGIRQFLTDIDEADFRKFYQEHGARFPLKYSNDLDELNFLSILTILNFLSAYRIPLHERTGQGAYDCIRRFVLGCYISGLQDEGTSLMTAEGMVNLNEHRVSELLNIPVMVEKDHPTLPVKIGERDADATEIVGLVLKVMQETGRILQQQGKKDLGTWVADVLRGTTDMTPVERTDRLVKQLVETFPAFADHGTVKGRPVKVYKKAQLLAFLVAVEFKGREGVSFPLPDPNVITACVDNVVPTMAVHFKLIDLSGTKYDVYKNGLGKPEAGKKVEGIRQTAEEAFAIRSATLAACERTVELTSEVGAKTGKEWLKTITAMDLDGYLWQKAKDGSLRDLPRLSERGTVFY